MGKRTFPVLVEALTAHGLPGDTPAILAEAVGTPEQHITRSTIDELSGQLSRDVGHKPALILYGPLADFEGPGS